MNIVWKLRIKVFIEEAREFIDDHLPKFILVLPIILLLLILVLLLTACSHSHHLILKDCPEPVVLQCS